LKKPEIKYLEEKKPSWERAKAHVINTVENKIWEFDGIMDQEVNSYICNLMIMMMMIMMMMIVMTLKTNSY